nr:hypothetical protein [Xanthomonas axonopodis]
MATDRETGLLQAAYAAVITRPDELANFMAQVGHESGGLNRLEEGFRYARGPSQVSSKVRSALREGPETLEEARLDALRGQPEKLAELMYGGRMRNDEPGDGYLYRGRGYIQLTGKDQYREAGEALKLDLVAHPDWPRNRKTRRGSQPGTGSTTCRKRSGKMRMQQALRSTAAIRRMDWLTAKAASRAGSATSCPK